MLLRQIIFEKLRYTRPTTGFNLHNTCVFNILCANRSFAIFCADLFRPHSANSSILIDLEIKSANFLDRDLTSFRMTGQRRSCCGRIVQTVSRLEIPHPATMTNPGLRCLSLQMVAKLRHGRGRPNWLFGEFSRNRNLRRPPETVAEWPALDRLPGGVYVLPESLPGSSTDFLHRRAGASLSFGTSADRASAAARH